MRMHIMPKIGQVALLGEGSRWLLSVQWTFWPGIKFIRLFWGNGLYRRFDKTWRW